MIPLNISPLTTSVKPNGTFLVLYYFEPGCNAIIKHCLRRIMRIAQGDSYVYGYVTREEFAAHLLIFRSSGIFHLLRSVQINYRQPGLNLVSIDGKSILYDAKIIAKLPLNKTHYVVHTSIYSTFIGEHLLEFTKKYDIRAVHLDGGSYVYSLTDEECMVLELTNPGGVMFGIDKLILEKKVDVINFCIPEAELATFAVSSEIGLD